ncbi:MAG: FtsQ-type POTRA domain-containing protein [Desulfovibrio sp.]|nr:FtsQ-type POTRA domain-containing protein [Desulfovibrio sp.]
MSATVRGQGRRGNFYVERKPLVHATQEKKKWRPRLSFLNTGKIKRATIIFLALCSFFLLTIAIGKIFIWFYDAAVTSELFVTKTIEVTGNVRLPRDVVLDYANIHEGENSLAVNIANIEQNLRRTPWVEAVSVKRLLPDKFIIRIRERMPSFWVRRDGTLFYATEEGAIIAPVESTNFLSLPALTVEAGAEGLRPYLVRFRESVRSGDLPLDMAQISMVTLSLSKGLELYLEDREMWLSFDPTDWDRNVYRIKRVITDLIRRREMKNVREMRVVDGHVWVVLNQSAKNLSGTE